MFIPDIHSIFALATFITVSGLCKDLILPPIHLAYAQYAALPKTYVFLASELLQLMSNYRPSYKLLI